MRNAVVAAFANGVVIDVHPRRGPRRDLTAGGIFVGMLWYTQNAKHRQEVLLQEAEGRKVEAKLAEEKAAQEAKLAAARNRQEDALRVTRSATDALGRFAAALASVRADADSLKTNDAGRLVALHPSLVPCARQIFDANLPTLPAEADVNLRIENVRRIEQKLIESTSSTYVPTPETTAEADQSSAWAADQTRTVEEVRNLIQESKIRFTKATLSADSPTLDAAISRLTESELSTQQQVAVARLDDARPSAAEAVAKAEAKRILAEPKAKAEKIVSEAADIAAQQKREAAIRAANTKVEEAKVQVATRNTKDEARKVELRRKADDPEIRARLAPFITPGYWQLHSMGMEKKPLSFTALQSTGALESTPKGGQTMAKILSFGGDKIRPRWNINSAYWISKPENIERIKEARQLLSELGPVLVEMKLLEP